VVVKQFGNSEEILPVYTFYPHILPTDVRMSSAFGYNGSVSHLILTMVTDADIWILIQNFPNLLKLVPFLIGYGCADTDTDSET